MRMRMITDDAMEVHFGLRLLDRAADHAYCHNYPGVYRARELRHLQCWSNNYSNTLKDEARLCGSSLPIGPIALPALGRSRPGPKKSHMTLMGFEPQTFRPTVRRANHCATGAG